AARGRAGRPRRAGAHPRSARVGGDAPVLHRLPARPLRRDQRPAQGPGRPAWGEGARGECAGDLYSPQPTAERAGGFAMNIAVREPRSDAAERLLVVDCDIHPNPRSPRDVLQFLPQRWQRHMITFGSLSREMYSDTIGYPRMAPAISRADSWPPAGGPPGSDLDFMRQQHLDPNGVEIGNLIPLATRGPDQRNLDYAAALCTALNDWQLAYWLEKEPRLRGSMLVPHEDPAAAVAEIERPAGNPPFVP